MKLKERELCILGKHIAPDPVKAVAVNIDSRTDSGADAKAVWEGYGRDNANLARRPQVVADADEICPGYLR